MKRSLYISILLAVAACAALMLGVSSYASAVSAPRAFYQPIVAAMVNKVSSTTVYSYDAQLSGEVSTVIGGQPYTITTRNTRSGVPIQKATQFVYEHLQQHGLDMSYQAWSACSTSGRNVIGTLPGLVKPQEIVLITAHVDDMPSSGAAPGADDNASGSVGVMVAADILSNYRFERTLRFVFFTGEEQGLCGSEAYADERYAAGDDIVAVYNLDMIAWDAVGGPTLRLHTRTSGNPGYAADLAIAGVFTNVVQSYGLSSALTPIIDADGESASDHASFWSNGYPAILAIEDDVNDFNAYYHTSNDRLANLNLPYFTAFVKASVGTVAHLAAPLPYGVLQGTIGDSANGQPIAAADVTAVNGATSNHAVSNVGGQYTLWLSAGQYSVTASAYGYAPATIDIVTVPADVTTTQPITLTSVRFYTVTGSIRDAMTQRPISAAITIDGYPYDPIATDLLNGYYSVALAEGVTYTFHIEANVAGYLSSDRTVGPLTADRVEDFALAPDLAACTAPGYEWVGIRESFALPMLTTQWVITGTAEGWSYNNPAGRPNLTGGTGSFAIADSDHFGAGVNVDTELRSPAMDFSTVTTPTLTFKTDFNYYTGGSAEVADVDVSVDDGASWTNVWRKTESYRGPQTVTLDLPQAAGQSQVRARFHYYNAVWDAWWEVDDVTVGVCRAPQPLPHWTVYLPMMTGE